jgi:hypothetical protein
MAPFTRSQARQTTLDRPITIQEYTTKTRIRFFYNYDNAGNEKKLATIYTEYSITERTVYNWLRQRRELGSPIYSRTRKLSNILGPHQRVPKDTIQMLKSPSRNLVRDQPLEAQIKYHGILLKKRQLTNRLLQDTHRARRYKIAYSKSSFSQSNVDARRKHGEKYEGKTVEDTYQFWVYSDEAYFDPSA